MMAYTKKEFNEQFCNFERYMTPAKWEECNVDAAEAMAGIDLFIQFLEGNMFVNPHANADW